MSVLDVLCVAVVIRAYDPAVMTVADLPRKGLCNEQGPYSTHCTDRPMHDYSCYDAQDDSSWNSRSPEDWQTEVGHQCGDADCMAEFGRYTALRPATRVGSTDGASA